MVSQGLLPPDVCFKLVWIQVDLSKCQRQYNHQSSTQRPGSMSAASRFEPVFASRGLDTCLTHVSTHELAPGSCPHCTFSAPLGNLFYFSGVTFWGKSTEISKNQILAGRIKYLPRAAFTFPL